jgi:hypothetical protein
MKLEKVFSGQELGEILSAPLTLMHQGAVSVIKVEPVSAWGVEGFRVVYDVELPGLKAADMKAAILKQLQAGV